MKKKILIGFYLLSIAVFGQQNSIEISMSLQEKKDILSIQQTTVFYNTSDSTLTSIFFHNWPNSFKDRKTPLTKRLIEDYNKSLYFAKEKKRGHTRIENLVANFETVEYSQTEEHPDILEVFLKKPLLPKDSVSIVATYNVKIPSAQFTGYGKITEGYHLRYWYLIPASHKNEWSLMSNLNLNDLLVNPTSYQINLKVPDNYYVNSNLSQSYTTTSSLKEYILSGKNKTDIIVNISTKKDKFKLYDAERLQIRTDITNKLNQTLTRDILNREILFIEKHLGSYPHKELFIDKVTQQKNPIYGLNQLPNFLRPFSDVFIWDLTMFKAVCQKYVEQTLLLNKREDYWLSDGIQTYLLMKYVDTYYPEVKLIGNVSKIWGIRNFNFSKLNFNDKYHFIYQFTARRFLDQSLDTPLDSLSNFNRKIANKYKAGLSLKYLSDYVGDSILQETFRDYYKKFKLLPTTSTDFSSILKTKTSKDVSWFFGDYLTTNKKIDYKITHVTTQKDSVFITIKNKRNITTPVSLYGVKNKKIKYKRWIDSISDTKTVSIPKGDFDRVALNYENSYPEINSLNNYKSLTNNFFSKPLKLRFLKDIDDPYYHQLYYMPNIDYNFYDGLIVGLRLHNKPIISRYFQFSVTPSYGIKSGSLTGSFYTRYNQFFNNSNVYRVQYELLGSSQSFAPSLRYKTFNQRITMQFRRKSLRDVGTSFLSAQLLNIDKDVPLGTVKTDQDEYSVFNVRFFHTKPNIIKEFQYEISSELGSKFSKLSADFRYRSLTDANRQLDFRVFSGFFLHNNTRGDYFSYGLDRANDYLFQLNYLGRSESAGLFSQQFILAEGGFKSVLPTRFANEYMVSFNSSVGLWRWLEMYNDVAFLKNRNQPIFFGYESGIRLNFVHNILEFYFPFYSNNGWEIGQEAYPSKIRFVFNFQPAAIFNFFRRGFL